MTNQPTFIKAKGGPKFMHPCVVCGAWGSFGVDARLRKAMEQKDVALAGTW